MQICVKSSAIKALIGVVLAVCFIIPETLGLQCYNCRGITNYDPSSCFAPENGRTIKQECLKTEWCEKRIHRIDRLQEVIERGCSSNCNARTYFWTDEFRVYCCEGENLCNNSHRLGMNIFTLSCVLTAICLIRTVLV